MSIVFYHNEEQRILAMESKAREEASRGEIYTEILPYTGFYLAEAYHQKYYLRQIPVLMEELEAIYPDVDDFIASTAVARLNGYAGGYGTQETLQEDLSSLGLSAEGNEKLLEIAGRGLSPVCPIPLTPASEPKLTAALAEDA